MGTHEKKDGKPGIFDGRILEGPAVPAIVAAPWALAALTAATLGGAAVMAGVGVGVGLLTTAVCAAISHPRIHPSESLIMPVTSGDLSDSDGLSDALKALHSLLVRVHSESQRIIDDPASGEDGGKAVIEFRDMLDRTEQVMTAPGFIQSAAYADRQLLYSLVSTYSPDTWDAIVQGVYYMSFGGEAGEKARKTVKSLRRQTDIINEAIKRIQVSMVEGVGTSASIGINYIKSRIDNEERKEGLGSMLDAVNAHSPTPPMPALESFATRVPVGVPVPGASGASDAHETEGVSASANPGIESEKTDSGRVAG